jgi:hypothetical protein
LYMRGTRCAHGAFIHERGTPLSLPFHPRCPVTASGIILLKKFKCPCGAPDAVLNEERKASSEPFKNIV